MNKRSLLLVVSILLFTGIAGAQVRQKPVKYTPVQLAEAVLKAFEGKDFSQLDKEHPYLNSIQVAFRSEYDETTTVGNTVKSLKQATKGLFADLRKPDPGTVNSGPVKKCEKGVCTYDVEVTLHRMTILHSISYGMKNGSAYIKRITFAGDYAGKK